MSAGTKIEWTDDSWPVVSGCDYVSTGCAHCWAVRDSHRLSFNPHPGVSAVFAGTTEKRDGRVRWSGVVRCHPDRLTWPLSRLRGPRIFVANMGDLFHDAVPDDFLDRVFAVAAVRPDKTFQILTKRPGRLAAYVNAVAGDPARFADWSARAAGWAASAGAGWSAPPAWPLRNVWLGVSVENRQTAAERIPLLRAAAAAVRFLSVEPLLEDLAGADFAGIDWAVIGGESGPGARECRTDWLRSAIRAARAAGAAVFVKQLGAVTDAGRLGNRKGGDPAEWPEDLRLREFPGAPASSAVRGPPSPVGPTKAVNVRDEDCDVYVGRGGLVWLRGAAKRTHVPRSDFHNPFRVGRDGDRDQVLAKFRDYLAGRPDLIARCRSELRGKRLGCHCRPEPCHAEILARVADGGEV